MSITLTSLLLAAMLLLAPALSSAITLGQSDNFTGGSTDNWQGGAGLVNVSSGGPLGANDSFLQIQSGPGAAARLVSFNQLQWLGNYLSAGVTGVSMDLKNFGATPLSLRIAIREGTGGASTPGYSSTVPFNLPADGDWHQAFFSLAAADLTGINSPQSLATDLAAVADFRILDSSAPSTIGDAITAQVGVDNVTAVPEPAGLSLAFLSVLTVSFCAWAQKS